jgi:CrcB protein
VAAVAAGGALGGLARWAVGLAVPWEPPSVPVATLTVNLVGCIAIGVLLTVWTEGPTPPWWARPFAAVGFVGGFTTFSAFALEGVRLVDAGAPGTAIGYIAVSVVAGLVLVRLSSVLTRRLVGPAGGGLR